MSIHGIYKTMGIGHCLIVWALLNLRDSSAADKTLTQRLLYVLSPAFRPSGASERTTVQKYEFLELQGDVFFFRTPSHQKNVPRVLDSSSETMLISVVTDKLSAIVYPKLCFFLRFGCTIPQKP